MIEKYFKRPVLYDFIISMLIICAINLLQCYDMIEIPSSDKNYQMASDIGSIGLTISGFLLTMITILLTVKSDQLLGKKVKLKKNSSAFKIFLNSPLYKKSIIILKSGVLSMVIVSILLYAMKLGLSPNYWGLVYFANIIGLFIILSTFIRCFYVLSLILKMQS